MGAGDDGLVAIDNKARVVDPGDRVVFLQVVALSPKTARLGCAACSHESDVPAGELMRACKYARPCQYHPHEMTMALLSDGKNAAEVLFCGFDQASMEPCQVVAVREWAHIDVPALACTDNGRLCAPADGVGVSISRRGSAGAAAGADEGDLRGLVVVRTSVLGEHIELGE